MALTVTIGGVDYTAYIDHDGGGVTITSAINEELDTATVALLDPPSLPKVWDEMVIARDGTTIFGGFVLSVDRQGDGGVGETITVSASDYGVYLKRVIVKKAYKDQYDGDIIRDLIITYAPEYDATSVPNVNQYPDIRINRKSLFEVIDVFAAQAQAHWYVDYSKKIVWVMPDSLVHAPWAVSDSPDMVSSFPCHNLTMNTVGDNIANVIEVVGGHYLSNDVTDIYPSSGQRTRIQLDFRYRAPDSNPNSILVWRNDGDDTTPLWTPLTVKVGYIDELTGPDEVLYYYQEKILEMQNPWPDLNQACKITGKREIPLRVRVRDSASINLYGREFHDVIVDNNITSKEVAKALGRAELARRAFANPALSFDVYREGLRSGMTISVTDSVLGVNDEFVIQRVTMRWQAPALPVWSVEAGVYNPDLVMYLLQLSRSWKKEAPWREDEVLDEVLNVYEGPVEAWYTVTHSTTQPPYLLGPVNPGDTPFLLSFATLA